MIDTTCCMMPSISCCDIQEYFIWKTEECRCHMLVSFWKKYNQYLRRVCSSLKQTHRKFWAVRLTSTTWALKQHLLSISFKSLICQSQVGSLLIEYATSYSFFSRSYLSPSKFAKSCGHHWTKLKLVIQIWKWFDNICCCLSC